MKTIKESKNLSSLHSIHENIRKASKDTDIDFFVESITNIEWPYNKKTIASDLKKIGRILSEGYLHLGETAKTLLPINEKEINNLSVAVNYIIENKKHKNNIIKYSDTVKIIKEQVKTNENVMNIFETVNLDELAEKMINEFNVKYKDKLTTEEVNVLKEISTNQDKEVVFNRYKEICTNKLTEAKNNFEKNGDISSSDRLKVVLEQISNKTYALETIGTDICSLIELSNIFEV
jgi:hypothetical protein